MSSRNREPLSRSEWKIMKIAWELKSCAARDVYKPLEMRTAGRPARSNHSAQTGRKGIPETTQIGNSFLYQPTQPHSSPCFTPLMTFWGAPWKALWRRSWPIWSRRATCPERTSPNCATCWTITNPTRRLSHDYSERFEHLAESWAQFMWRSLIEAACS